MSWTARPGCRALFAAGLVAAAIAPDAGAIVIHRSFRSREVGFGFGTGSARVAVPLEAKAAKALDEALETEANRPAVVVGRATRVLDGRTFNIVTGGGSKFTIRLEDVEAPAADDAGKAVARLKRLVVGRMVRVECKPGDPSGILTGRVTVGRQDVNLLMGRDAEGKDAADK